MKTSSLTYELYIKHAKNGSSRSAYTCSSNLRTFKAAKDKLNYLKELYPTAQITILRVQKDSVYSIDHDGSISVGRVKRKFKNATTIMQQDGTLVIEGK